MDLLSSRELYYAPRAELQLGERLCAALLVVLFSPLLIACAAAVWVLSRRAPLVAHRRVGRFGEPFRMLKLRTMWDGGAGLEFALVERLGDEHVPENKTGDDPRVTHGFARLLRRYSLDELPQLMHAVSGRMSMVGPRPVTAAELEEHYGAAAWEVLRVRPGITGLWQVMGRNRLSYRQRRRLGGADRGGFGGEAGDRAGGGSNGTACSHAE